MLRAVELVIAHSIERNQRSHAPFLYGRQADRLMMCDQPPIRFIYLYAGRHASVLQHPLGDRLSGATVKNMTKKSISHKPSYWNDTPRLRTNNPDV
jgi:hypothetical protein